MEIAQDEDAVVQKHPTSQQWENFKEILSDLYIEQGRSLTDVEKEMAGRGFTASLRMYKSRFDGWGWGKNTLRQDWQAFVIMKDRAKTAGIDLRQVQIHRRIRNLAELARYLRSQKISEAAFLDEALEAGVSVPDHVQSIPVGVSETEQVATIDGLRRLIRHPSNYWKSERSTSLLATEGAESFLSQSPLDNAHQSSYGGTNAVVDSQLQLVYPHEFPLEGGSSPQIYPHHDRLQSSSGRLPSGLSVYLNQAVNPMSGIMPPGPSFVHLSEMAGRLSVPAPPRVLPHSIRGIDGTHSGLNLPDPMFQTLAQTRQETRLLDGLDNVGDSSHLSPCVPLTLVLPMPVPGSVPDPTIRYVQTEEHHAFMGDVFMACMSVAARAANQDVDLGEKNLAEVWMDQAILKLRMMCAAQDPMFLVTVHMILVWLQVHDTESRAESVIRELSQATAIELGEDSPIAIILGYMTFAAGKGLRSSRFGFDALRGVVRQFEVHSGPEHPHTLVALYYMCFYMMSVEGKYAEAEKRLTKIYTNTSKILGKSSFQSVCVLATLSRAQTRQGKDHAALDTINQCLQEAPLGLNHPHRLELLVRKALICWSLKDKLKPEEQIERLYWDEKIIRLYNIVVMGRVATLGRYHESTEAAHETLVEILVESGKYEMDTVKGETHELLTKPQVAVSAYECWWWSMVPKHREGKKRQAVSDGMG